MMKGVLARTYSCPGGVNGGMNYAFLLHMRLPCAKKLPLSHSEYFLFIPYFLMVHPVQFQVLFPKGVGEIGMLRAIGESTAR